MTVPTRRTIRFRPAVERGGFTLAELLISIAILATGMSMIAAIFPAGLTQAQQTTEDVMGMTICQNGLNLLPLHTSHGEAPTGGYLYRVDLGDDEAYPVGETGANTGLLAFARQIGGTENDYLVAMVAYRHAEGGECFVQPVPATFSNNGDDKPMSVSFERDVEDSWLGSPVLIRSTGQSARIRALDKDTDTAVLDAQQDDLPTGGPQPTFVFFDRTGNTRRSPAMRVLVTRMALPE